MDIAALNGVVQAINLTKQLAKAAFDGKVDAEAKAKIGEVLEKLGDVQDGMFSLREDLHRLQVERDGLKKKLDAADSWQQRTAAFKITQTAGGAVVYISNDETPYYVCPSCFNKKEIHPLQDNRTARGKYRCTGCTAEFPIKPQARTSGVQSVAHHWNE